MYSISLPQGLADSGFQSIRILASQGSGSFQTCYVQASGELAEAPVGFKPGSDLARPSLGLLVGFSFPVSGGFVSFSFIASWCWISPG